jgi:hypothetical protein
VIFDAAVVIPTTLTPVLARAVRSVYAQDFAGSVQIMIGIDVDRGARGLLDELRRECPPRIALSVVDLGYSTSARHGGFYRNWSGGALRTILSYAANSRYLAYLDDDNWWAPAHLSGLLAAIRGVDWAFSYRWYVDPESGAPMCIDEWESVGPGRGMYNERYGGFVDTNCLMLDKEKCHWVLPAWCIAGNSKGAGIDRVVFRELNARHSWACTGEATAYYVIRREDVTHIRRLMSGARDRSARAGGGGNG